MGHLGIDVQSPHMDELGKLPFKESYPTPETSARLDDEPGAKGGAQGSCPISGS